MKQYYQDAALTVRDLCAEDIPLICFHPLKEAVQKIL